LFLLKEIYPETADEYMPNWKMTKNLYNEKFVKKTFSEKLKYNYDSFCLALQNSQLVPLNKKTYRRLGGATKYAAGFFRRFRGPDKNQIFDLYPYRRMVYYLINLREDLYSHFKLFQAGSKHFKFNIGLLFNYYLLDKVLNKNVLADFGMDENMREDLENMRVKSIGGKIFTRKGS